MTREADCAPSSLGVKVARSEQVSFGWMVPPEHPSGPIANAAEDPCTSTPVTFNCALP
jgi:hypothetical protein